MEEGESYLAADMANALSATLRFCPVLASEPEERLAAIVDFTFNLGPGRLQASTLRRRINQRDWTGTAQELRRWIYGGGKVLPGLVLRREAETLLLLSNLLISLPIHPPDSALGEDGTNDGHRAWFSP